MSSNSTCPADVTFEQAAARGASIAFFVCFFLYVILYLLRHNKITVKATKWWTWLIGNFIEGVIVGALFAGAPAAAALRGGGDDVPDVARAEERRLRRLGRHHPELQNLRRVPRRGGERSGSRSGSGFSLRVVVRVRRRGNTTNALEEV